MDDPKVTIDNAVLHVIRIQHFAELLKTELTKLQGEGVVIQMPSIIRIGVDEEPTPTECPEQAQDLPFDE